VPEVFLHRFFGSMGTPYRAYEAEDPESLQKAIADVTAANPRQLADYRAGKDKLFGFFVGQVMKATAGKANPAQVNELLKRMLAGP